MAAEALCVAGALMQRVAAMGERVSLVWNSGANAITFNWQPDGWFWTAYDHRARRTLGSGWAATIGAAVDQAKAATQAPALAAE